jgi:hypothetical protein
MGDVVVEPLAVEEDVVLVMVLLQDFRGFLCLFLRYAFAVVLWQIGFGY